jgi:uncharacterized protein (DUF302 family)
MALAGRVLQPHLTSEAHHALRSHHHPGPALPDAITRVKDAFGAQGFGTLTEIDVQATLKQKLGHDTDPYVILGTCNPQLAHQALQLEPEIGLLLPCNVVVRRQAGTTLVHALDPQVMVQVPQRPELQPLADEANRRIRAALDTLDEEAL